MTDWAEVAGAIEAQLPSETGFRVPHGEALADRLRTYGAFRDELEREKAYDEAVAATQAIDPIEPTPAVSATLTIGGLTLTARPPGASGNGIAVTVANGAAASFTVAPIDPDIAEQHRQSAITALSGTIEHLSTDPALAALQQEAAAYLGSLDPGTRARAEEIITERWPDYRVARAGLAVPRERKKLEDALDSLGLDAEVKTSALQTWDARDTAFAEAAQQVFTLTISQGEVIETYSEVVPGYDFRIASSVLIQSAAWDGNTRPPNGTYALAAGVNGTPGRAGRKAPKPIGEYVFHVDSERVFTLEELREIVAQAIEGGREWLAGSGA